VFVSIKGSAYGVSAAPSRPTRPAWPPRLLTSSHNSTSPTRCGSASSTPAHRPRAGRTRRRRRRWPETPTPTPAGSRAVRAARRDRTRPARLGGDHHSRRV